MPRCDGAHQGQPAALAWFHMPRWWEREGLDVGRPPTTFHVSSSQCVQSPWLQCPLLFNEGIGHMGVVGGISNEKRPWTAARI